MIAQIKRDYALKTDAAVPRRATSPTRDRDRLTVIAASAGIIRQSSLGAARSPAQRRLPGSAAGDLTRDGGQERDRLEHRHAARRHHLRARRDRKTVVRASYAMFASQLLRRPRGVRSRRFSTTGIYYNAVDTNGDKVADPNELLFGLGNRLLRLRSEQPGRATDRQPDRQLQDADHAGIRCSAMDHELLPNFGVSATFTYRQMVNFDWRPPDRRQVVRLLARPAPSTRLCGTIHVGSALQRAVLCAQSAAVPAGGGESYETNARATTSAIWVSSSAPSSACRNHWMARFGFSTNNDREYFSGAGCARPTRRRSPGGAPTSTAAWSSRQSGRQRQEHHLSGRCRSTSSSPTAVPRSVGLNFGANWLLRQGYAEPFFRSSVNDRRSARHQERAARSTDGERSACRRSARSTRASRSRFTFAPTERRARLRRLQRDQLDTVLGKQYDARLTGATGFNQTLEIMNPRIARLGARFTF